MISDPVFFIFSDDLAWAKKNIIDEHIVFVEHSEDSDYSDWMDMYLMSICKHNIIANSLFSWWGAWLNVNKDKVVVAPLKWCNSYENDEVCPLE